MSEIIGIPEFKAAISGWIAKSDEATKAAITKAAHIVEANAKKRAGSGRPGPNVVTGNLRRSIKVEGPTKVGFASYSAKIGPTMNYARRVELGFDGADALGRVYHQQPYAFMAPGFADSQEDIKSAFEEAWKEARKL